MTTARLRPLFSPGTVLVSPDAQEILASGGVNVQELLLRHVAADWDPGMDEELTVTNRQAIAEGGAIISTWQLGGYTLWIRTDAARETTIIDLPLDN